MWLYTIIFPLLKKLLKPQWCWMIGSKLQSLLMEAARLKYMLFGCRVHVFHHHLLHEASLSEISTLPTNAGYIHLFRSSWPTVQPAMIVDSNSACLHCCHTLAHTQTQFSFRNIFGVQSTLRFYNFGKQMMRRQMAWQLLLRETWVCTGGYKSPSIIIFCC